jgi:hypothetical protein
MSDNILENKVFLSSEHIKVWQDERMTLAAELVSIDERTRLLRARIEEIDKMLQSAAIFVPALKEWLESISPEDAALTEAILKTLRARAVGTTLSRDGIKARLPQHGYPASKLEANPNYLYTAMKRLIDRGLIVERTPGGYMIKR